MSNADPRASGGATYRVLRELGARSQHSYAAIREPHELVVVQRFVRAVIPLVARGSHPDATPLDAPSMALLLRDARCLAKNWHPNVGRVRHVDLAGNELTIATELLDGATLGDLFAEEARERTSARDPLLALPVLVRILLDVLGGLHALHGLRDGISAPLGAIHGELCPANIVVGKDGVARIIDVLRPRPIRVVHPSAAAGYAAPEALDVGGTADPRADVYAVGVILWEALAGGRLFDETEPARVLSRQREAEIALPSIHPSSPFAGLAEIAMRAIAFDPALRFRGALEMAAELRKVAGARLASGSAVATRVLDLAGDRIRMRRALLEPATSGTRRRASEGSILAAQNAVRERAQVARASPRVVVPTVAADVPDTLVAASRRSLPDGVEVEEKELPGPRGSTPELDLEAALVAAIAASQARHEEQAAREAAAANEPNISPLTPNVPFSSAPPIVLTRRAPAHAAGSETPGEQVLPIAATAPAASRVARPRAATMFVVVAALFAAAAGASVAMRSRGAERPVAATGLTEPPPALVEPPPPPAEVLPSNASAEPAAPAIATAAIATAAIATATVNAPMPRVAPPRAPTPPPAPVAKPKKSVYEPDGL